jgi:hypothetical protein
MIRLSWRQFRSQGAVVFGVLGVIAVVLAATGPHLVHLYDADVVQCRAHGDCATTVNAFLGTDHLLAQLGDVLVAAPALLGLFWGAPLIARELESGTYRLAWTQSVSRTRWTAVKLGLTAVASVVAVGLFSLMVTWWSSPIDRADMNPFGVFDQRGIVPVGYAAFAFALGVVAGVLIRRTVPAMATTLVVYVAVRLAVTDWLRPRFEAPVTLSQKLRPLIERTGPHHGSATIAGLGSPPASGVPGAWILSSTTFDPTGHVVSNGVYCPGLFNTALTGNGSALRSCLARYTQVTVYQPSNRYWPFQGYETALFLGLALMLTGFCFWWVRNRLV